MKQTKQKVRDLNFIKAPPRGKKLAPLPIDQLDACPHNWVEEHMLHEAKCSHCNEVRAF
jgi:hypothetical protein